MSDFQLSRRNLLLTASLGALVAGVPGLSQAQAAVTRYDVATSQGQVMLDSYANAVAAMKKLDPPIGADGIPTGPCNPFGWIFQSFIHAIPKYPLIAARSPGLWNGTPEFVKRVDKIYGNPASGSKEAAWKQAALTCWAGCPHGSSNFVSWHRWYVYYFEQICRAMSGNANFTLPYWNYGSNDSTSLQLPKAFQDKSSPLYEADRGLGFSSGAGTGKRTVPMNNNGFLPFIQTDYNPSLGTSVLFPSDDEYATPPSSKYDSFGFSGRVECSPHDNVHDNVGGLMSNVPSAAADPVFYLHHCQIDRLWATFQAGPNATYNWGNGASGSASPSKPAWLGAKFSFVNAQGSIVTVDGEGELNIATLGYSYDILPAIPSASTKVAALKTEASSKTSGKTIAVAAMQGSLTIGSGGAESKLTSGTPTKNGALKSSSAQESEAKELVLSEITLVKRPPAPLEVFINQPAGSDPELGSIYYVGPINLFKWETGERGPMKHGTGHAGHTRPGQFRFDVADLVAKQKAAGVWKSGQAVVTVSLLGADNSKGETYLKVGKVELLP